MSLKIGMPALIEAPGLAESVMLAQELGLDFIEINSNLPIYRMDTLDIAAARRIMTGSGVFLTLHAEEYLHLTDLDERVSRLYYQILLQEIEAAKQLEIPVVNLHLFNGVRYTLPDRKVYVFEAYRDQFLAGFQALREACTAAVGSSGIIICVENLDGYIDVVREGIEILLESPAFALTWDIGHDHCAKGADRDYLTRCASRVKHMHIHDALLPDQNHLPLGEGEIDLEARFAFAREQDARCVIEIKTLQSLRQSVAWLRERPELLR